MEKIKLVLTTVLKNQNHWFSQKCENWPTLAYALGYTGQSELTATNAPVGRSVHWMGCVFSFGAGWGS